MENKFKIGGIFYVKCIAPTGVVKWEDSAPNIIPDVALDYILDVTFNGTVATDPWYVGLKNVGAVAAADTAASHAGWTENTNYTGTRKEYVAAASSGESITNTASVASFAIDTDTQTIAGALLDSTTSGTAGILISVADFTGGNKSADNGDTLEVTYVVSATSA